MSRYIDADIACRKLSYCRFQGLMRCGEGMKELMQAYNPSSVTVGFDYGTQLALEVVGSIPTADVVEVVHGKWLPDYETFVDEWERESEPIQTGWVCSLCGRQEFQQEPYCNCGAKMDGEKVE